MLPHASILRRNKEVGWELLHKWEKHHKASGNREMKEVCRYIKSSILTIFQYTHIPERLFRIKEVRETLRRHGYRLNINQIIWKEEIGLEELLNNTPDDSKQ